MSPASVSDASGRDAASGCSGAASDRSPWASVTEEPQATVWQTTSAVKHVARSERSAMRTIRDIPRNVVPRHRRSIRSSTRFSLRPVTLRYELAHPDALLGPGRCERGAGRDGRPYARGRHGQRVEDLAVTRAE